MNQMSLKTGRIKFNCEKMGDVILTKNTPIKSGTTFPSIIEGCNLSQEYGVGLPYDKKKCENNRKNI